MMKLYFVLYAIFLIFKIVVKAAVNILKTIFRKKKTDTTFASNSRNWYGICDNCATKGGLHAFDDKKYCARCYAIFDTEKKFGIKIKSKW